MNSKVFITRHLPEAASKEIPEDFTVDLWDYETPPPYEILLKHIRDKDGLLCLLTDRIDAQLMDTAPGLKVISLCAVGFDNIDINSATTRGIRVGYTPGVLTNATADFAFTLMVSAARRVVEGVNYVKDGRWETWGLTLLLGQDIWHSTLGIIGFGRIGQALTRRVRGFEMNVVYYDLIRQPEAEYELDAHYLPLDELLRQSDFISIHTNLTPETRGLINSTAFSKMKSNAVLVNTSRGPIVDPDALYQALFQKKIAAAAIDVTDPEPLPANHKLLSLPNLIVVPHIASATVTSRNRMALMAVRNLVAGVQGEPLPYPVN
jgi:glyoxylate reductase